MGAWVPDPPLTLPCWEEKTGGGRGGARRVTEEKGEGEERGEPRRGAAEAEGSSGSEPLLPPVSALSASRGPNQSLESPGGAEGLLFAQGSLVLKAGFPHISSITWGQTCRFPPVFPPRRPARASGGFWCLVEGGPDPSLPGVCTQGASKSQLLSGKVPGLGSCGGPFCFPGEGGAEARGSRCPQSFWKLGRQGTGRPAMGRPVVA